MALSILYTNPAKETLSAVYEFIEGKFGLKAANRFLLKSEQIISLISEQPYIYKESAFEQSVRVAFISKQTSLYYRVTGDAIHLLFFWDNRQDPI